MALSKFNTVKFEAGHVIFRDGDPRKALYIIKSGQIEIFKQAKDGSQIPLGIVGSGEYLGELGLMDEQPYHSTWALALTEVEAIQLPTDVINEQLKSAPPWLVSLTKGLSLKLRHVNELIRRNGLVDPSLASAVSAAAENLKDLKDEKRKKGPK